MSPPLTECRYNLCKIKYFKTEWIKRNTDKTGQNKGIASASTQINKSNIRRGGGLQQRDQRSGEQVLFKP